jgi:uncharacterized protein
MSNYNSFRILSNLENGKSDVKELSIGGAVIAALTFFLILWLPESIAFGITNVASSNNILLSSLYTLFILAITFFVATALFYAYYIINLNVEKIVVNPIKKFTVINVILLILIVLGYLLFFDSLLLPVDKILPGFNLVTESMQIMAKNPVFLIGFTFIIGPILIELVFRGIIIGGLLKKYSSPKAILVSALISGISAFNLSGFICSFPLCILLGYIYVKTRSLYLCIIADILYNSITFILLQYYPQFLLLISSSIFIIGISTVIGLLIMYWALKKLSANLQKL